MRPQRSSPDELILGLVSVSDRASRGEYRDEGIPALEAWCRDAIVSPVTIHRRLIADDRWTIEETLRELVDRVGCDLVFTTGGTGPARRDVTPEATLAVATREMPGFGEQMRRISLNFVPTAILSRQVGVLRETPDHAALIVNLPGRPKSISETLGGLRSDDGEIIDDGIFAAIPYCIDLIGGPYIETNPEIVEAFRPKGARRPPAAAKTETAPAAAGSPAPSVLPQFRAEALKPGFPDERTGQAAAAPRGVPLYGAEKQPALPPLEVLVKDPVDGGDPACTVIWLHGMGTDAGDFVPFMQEVKEFGGPSGRFIFPNAPEIALSTHGGWRTTAWYDDTGRSPSEKEDEKGIRQMHLRVTQIINEIISTGVPAEKIFLGGFSQGAAMALYCGLRQARTLAGVICLSGYVPLLRTLPNEITPAGRDTPVFMAHGAFDSVISPVLAKTGADVAGRFVKTLIWRDYNMDHELCPDELTDIARFMNAALE